jgi:hypothetical protein
MSSASCSNRPSPAVAPEAARRAPFQNSLPAVAELIECSVRPVPVTARRPPSSSLLRAPGAYRPSVVVVWVTFADTVTVLVVRLIAVIVSDTAEPAPVLLVRMSIGWPTFRYWVESTVKLFAAAGELVRVARGRCRRPSPAG